MGLYGCLGLSMISVTAICGEGTNANTSKLPVSLYGVPQESDNHRSTYTLNNSKARP